jgi:hypothetical protein
VLESKRWPPIVRAFVIASTILVVVVLIVAAMATIGFWVAFGGPCIGQRDKFESAAWHTDDVGGNCTPRRGMVGDLVANELQSGRDRASIETMLGPTEGHWEKENDLIYALDCFIDCQWLVIEFDAQDRLERTYEAQD